MTLFKYQKLAISASDENGILKWCIGHKLGDRDPALESHQGQLVVFDTLKEAQAYIDEEE